MKAHVLMLALLAAPLAPASALTLSAKATSTHGENSPVQNELIALHAAHTAEVQAIEARAQQAFDAAQAEYDRAMSNINVPRTGDAAELNRRVTVALRERRASFERIMTEMEDAFEASVLNYVNAANSTCRRHTRHNCIWN